MEFAGAPPEPPPGAAAMGAAEADLLPWCTHPFAGSILDYLDAVIRVLELGFHPHAHGRIKMSPDRRKPDRYRSEVLPAHSRLLRWNDDGFHAAFKIAHGHIGRRILELEIFS